VGKSPDAVTYVGIHNRRTDYLDFRRNVLGQKRLRKNYFLDAVEYFNDEYDNAVFVYVSDDMKYGRKKLKNVSNVFFSGCGDPDDPGEDLKRRANAVNNFTSVKLSCELVS
jgi:galactoside 2-L-fucosyltransferase 1/2